MVAVAWSGLSARLATALDDRTTEAASAVELITEVDAAAELIAEVRTHACLNLPTTLGSLPASARITVRTMAKNGHSRNTQTQAALWVHLKSVLNRSYGGGMLPQTVATASSRRALVCLCRWII